jgi:hypothetical protein
MKEGCTICHSLDTELKRSIFGVKFSANKTVLRRGNR